MPGVLQAHPGWSLIAAAAGEAAGKRGRSARVDDAGLSGQGGCCSTSSPRSRRRPGAWPRSRTRCRGRSAEPAVELGTRLSSCGRRRRRRCATAAAEPGTGARNAPRGGGRDRGHELEAEPLVEDLIGDDELAALVEAHFAPTDHRGWPRTMFTTQGGIVWTVGGAGWNALLRAAFAVLLPLQCEGQTTPLPIGQVKERLGALIVDAWPSDDFRQGVVDVLTCYSQRICIHCGQPGTLRDGPTPWAGSAPSARRAGRRHRRTPGRPSAQRDREDKHPARAGMDRAGGRGDREEGVPARPTGSRRRLPNRGTYCKPRGS